ncbi:MAG: L,D-transpeptidase family protein [Anaerolineales bacterium]|nr:L,D-transpeptidase family protein [Anaerolineales bacterium]
MSLHISRRNFVKLSALGAGAVSLPGPLSSQPGFEPVLGRVTTTWIGLYTEPSFSSTRRIQLLRDELITILSTTQAESPSHNTTWYRIAEGYVHSGHVQLVRWNPQKPLTLLPEEGTLFEVSVPYTRSYEKPDPQSRPLYRHYYEAAAWITDVIDDSEGRLWYKLNDELLHTDYYARAEHFRWIHPEEVSPLSPDIPSHEKQLIVYLGEQTVRAFENGQQVFEASISSGIPDSEPRGNGIPTITPTGRFYIDKKMPVRHMGDGHLTADLEAYELPGIPWVSFFHETGVAFHGTYWHADFGRPKSHGCVNMRNEDARWVYRWSTPHVAYTDRIELGYGTSVVVK